ncbi:hypothetical protein Lal_00014707 [Lupinus albus]|nr:hypothetical protein Lal_00014707 [Lupinus albus]
MNDKQFMFYVKPIVLLAVREIRVCLNIFIQQKEKGWNIKNLMISSFIATTKKHLRIIIILYWRIHPSLLTSQEIEASRNDLANISI